MKKTWNEDVRTFSSLSISISFLWKKKIREREKRWREKRWWKEKVFFSFCKLTSSSFGVRKRKSVFIDPLSLFLSLHSLSSFFLSLSLSSPFYPIFSSKFDHRFLFILETKCYDLDHFVALSFSVLHHFVLLSILLLLFSLHLFLYTFLFFSILSKVNPSLI